MPDMSDTTRGQRMRLTRRIASRLTRSERGQSLVEFALILPPFLLLFAITLDLGRIAAARITVENAAREGAFEASRNNASFDASHAWLTSDPWNPATNPCDPETDSVTCRVLLESKSGAFAAIAPDDVQMSCDPSCTSGIGHTSTVTVQGEFTLLTPILYPFLGGDPNITFSGRSTTQIETLPVSSARPAASPTPTPTPNPSATPTPTPAPSPTPACSLPSAGFRYEASPKSMRVPLEIDVDDTSTASSSCPITSWLWSWGDGTSSTSRDPGIHTYRVAGTFEVTLTVSNAAGSRTSGIVRIQVKP